MRAGRHFSRNMHHSIRATFVKIFMQSTSTLAGSLLSDPRGAEATAQLGIHLLGIDVVEAEEDQGVEEEVGGFVHDLLTLPPLPGDHRLGGLLADLLEDLVDPL